MPIQEKTLEELLDRIGVQSRPRVRKAIGYEEEKAIGKALAEWEEIVSDARKDGKDVSVVQDHLKRLHQLWWQKGGPQGRDPLPEPSKRVAPSREGGEDQDRDKIYAAGTRIRPCRHSFHKESKTWNRTGRRGGSRMS